VVRVATIPTSAQKNILQITQWSGLNESPDGDTSLRSGEAASMRNFKVTREGHLQIRPGYGPVWSIPGTPGAVRALWYGYVAGRKRVLCACGGHIFELVPDLGWTSIDLGGCYQDRAGIKISIFGFSNKAYILTGDGYYVWDGAGQVREVEGYVPIVATATPPAGGGTVLEGVNLLTGKRRQQFSPDGSAKVFQLAETGVDEVVSVEGTALSYTLDKEKGQVTFAASPPAGTNTITITYRKGTGGRGQLTGMRFCEMFGTGDPRLFFYGDGSNKCYYSGLNEYGRSDPEYFPELNVIEVGTSNTPLTALIRHYDRLLAYKPDGAWAMEYTTLTLADGSITAAFRINSINREIGCEAPGQAQLVDNNPRTIFGRAVYDWPLSNAAIRDERNAKRISDRVTATMARFRAEDCIAFDDNDEQEYYIVCGSEALVHNYACDGWYYYTDLPATCMVKVEGTLYFGTPEGEVMEFSRKYRSDNRRDIDAYWESGSMAFGKEWMRKYSSLVWVGIKPETQAVLYLTAETNIKSDYPDKVIASGLANLVHADFAHWSFGTNRKPQVVRAKLKVKKATYYKLIFWSKSASATATIVAVDIQVRYTGNVK